MEKGCLSSIWLEMITTSKFWNDLEIKFRLFGARDFLWVFVSGTRQPGKFDRGESEPFSKNNCWTESEELETSFPTIGGRWSRKYCRSRNFQYSIVTALYTDEANSSSQEHESTLDDTNAEILKRPRKAKLSEWFGLKANAAIQFPTTTSDQLSVQKQCRSYQVKYHFGKKLKMTSSKLFWKKEPWNPFPRLITELLDRNRLMWFRR